LLQVAEFKLRKLISSAAIRKELAMYSQGRPSSKCPPLPDVPSVQALLGDLRTAHTADLGGHIEMDAQMQAFMQGAPAALADLLAELGCEECSGGGVKCPAMLSSLLYHLASDHSSDTLLVGSARAYDALTAIVEGGMLGGLRGPHEFEEHLKILHTDAHELWKLLMDVQADMENETISHSLHSLVSALLLLHYAVIGSKASCNSHSVSIDSVDAEQHDTMSTVINSQASLCHYDNWEVLHSRPQYDGLEKPNGRSVDLHVYRKCDNTRIVVQSGQRKFSPGIFKVSCPHGVVYGFHFMKDAESPSDMFTLLLTRFPRDKLPSMVYYDNGCKLYEYILNREPWMLQTLRVVVDAFHYGAFQACPVHKCPWSFDVKANHVARIYNSQYEEHSNAFVSIHKRSARTMRLSRARFLMALLLQLWNRSKFERIDRRREAFTLQYAECRLALGL
jgi:hypothetical protein